MRVAARNRGTYSRVSRLSSLVSVRSQKSSARARASARPTFRSPALYAAIASGQEPKRWYRSRRYWAAARVDLTGSRRSSIQLSTRRPYVLAVGLMNCHGPTALDLDTAFVLKPLSTSERKIKSAGRLNSAKTCSTIGPWRSSPRSQSSKRSRIWKGKHWMCFPILGVRTVGTSKSRVSSTASSGSVVVTSSNEVPGALSTTGVEEGVDPSMRRVESRVAPSGESPVVGSSGSDPDSASNRGELRRNPSSKRYRSGSQARASVGITHAVRIHLSSTNKKKRGRIGLSKSPLL